MSERKLTSEEIDELLAHYGTSRKRRRKRSAKAPAPTTIRRSLGYVLDQR